MSGTGGIMLEEYFRLKEHDTNIRVEIIAGLTTFLTASYIIFVHPDILAKTGMSKEATCSPFPTRKLVIRWLLTDTVRLARSGCSSGEAE